MMSAYFHITFQNRVAVRRELVIDKWRRCAPPDKRRRRAVARLLYFTYSTVPPNITQPNEKITVRERSRPAEPLSAGSAFPRTECLFHRISFFGYTVFCCYGLPRFYVG